MPKTRKQIVNPYIRFGRKAQGPYAQNLGGGQHGRAITRGEQPCFFIVSASIGDTPLDSDATVVTIRFNTDADATCDALGWTFLVNGLAPQQQNFFGVSGSLMYWSIVKDEANGVSPDDVVTFDYVPGTCKKLGSTEPECLLPAYDDYAVTNNVYGPIESRIGNIADNIVQVTFPVAPGVAGDTGAWRVEFDTNPVVINNIAIVGNTVELTLASAATTGNIVTYTHSVNGGIECESIDGRECFEFTDQPVINELGANYWIREDAGQWRVEDMGRWQLET